MYLDSEKREKFYKLFFSLLDYTNIKYKINKKMYNKLDRKKQINGEDIVEIREKIWSDSKVIDEYAKENPDDFNNNELDIIKSWKNNLTGMFFLIKHLNENSIFYCKSGFYGVVGISNEISDIIPSSELPTILLTTLIPFENVIIYDTLLMPISINCGNTMKKVALYEYKKAKENNDIITSLKDKNIRNVLNFNDFKKDNKRENDFYEIKVSIKNTKPLAWRRLQVPCNITFHELNAIIQLSFGWSGYHLYSFEDSNETNIEIPYEDNTYRKVKDSRKTKISNYFNQFKKIKYIYDFGDYWVHDVVVEKVIKKEESKPVCIKAKMANFPEDCGGPFGYKDLLEIISNKENDRYEEMNEWLNNGFVEWNTDREFVDIEEINESLEDYKSWAKELLNTDF